MVSPLAVYALAALGASGLALRTARGDGGPERVLWAASETGGPRAAEAIFERSDAGELLITLTNTSTSDVVQQDELLQALFFDFDFDFDPLDPPLLVPLKATLAPGSVIRFPEAAEGVNTAALIDAGDVSSEFAFRDDIGTDTPSSADSDAVPMHARYGISASGFGVFGPNQRINQLNPDESDDADDLDPPESPDGSNLGLLSAGDDPATGQSKVSGEEPLIQNAVTFRFALSSSFALDAIKNVVFQYGTSLSDPYLLGQRVVVTPPDGGAVPEPRTLVLLLLAVIALAHGRLRNATP